MTLAPDLSQLDLEGYAAITAALAEGARPRADVLSERGLDEASWAAIDDAYQAELSRVIAEDEEGIPPLVAAYAEAFERARAALRGGGPKLTIERFADATREIQRRGDPTAALSHLGITLADYLDANAYRIRRLPADPALFERYRSRLLR